MDTVYVIVVSLALTQQMTFSVLYWRWIPSWTQNPYGRMAQLGCWSLIIPLAMILLTSAIGHGRDHTSELMFIFGFLPLIAFGFLQLDLLKKAVDSGNGKSTEESEVSNDS